MTEKLTKEREQEIRDELRLEGGGGFVDELLQEIDALRAKDYSCTLGVGDGSGKLFVHGDYESIKQCQRLILERDELRSLLKNVTSLTFPGETDSVDAMLKIKKERDALKAENEKLKSHREISEHYCSEELTMENQKLREENAQLKFDFTGLREHQERHVVKLRERIEQLRDTLGLLNSHSIKCPGSECHCIGCAQFN